MRNAWVYGRMCVTERGLDFVLSYFQCKGLSEIPSAVSDL